MLLHIAITALTFLVLMYVGINLIGMLVRGLVLVADVEGQIAKGSDALKKVAAEAYDGSLERKVNWTALALIVIYLAGLCYFINIGVATAAVILMLARIPDLLWEIRHGRENVRQMPKVYHLTTIVGMMALPILWWSLPQ